MCHVFMYVLFQAEDCIRDLVRSRGLGDVYKRQVLMPLSFDSHTLLSLGFHGGVTVHWCCIPTVVIHHMVPIILHDLPPRLDQY